MDIGSLMKLKQMWATLCANHPKFLEFIQALKNKGLTEDTEVAITVTYPDGQELKTGVRLRRSDAELFGKILAFLGSKK